MSPKLYSRHHFQKSKGEWVVSLLMAICMSLVWTPSEPSAQQQEGTPLRVPPGVKLRATLDGKTEHVTVQELPGPKIAGIVVIEDQLEPPRPGWSHFQAVTAYPYQPGGEIQPGIARYASNRRTLFVWGENLPDSLRNTKLQSRSPHITYKPSFGRLTETRRVGFKKAAPIDKTFASGGPLGNYTSLVVDAKFEKGVLPGTKELLINGASGLWPLVFSDQVALMRFVREGGEAQYDPTDIFYTSDLGFVELVFQAPIPYEEIGIELRHNSAGGAEPETIGVLRATHLQDRARPTYRTQAIQLYDPDQPAPAPAEHDNAARVGVRKGDHIQARVFDRAEAISVPPFAIAAIHADPGELGPVWTDALGRVAGCYKEKGRRLTSSYAGEEATRVSRTILMEWLNRRSVPVLKGDHAAAILIRDEFVKMSEALLTDYAASPATPYDLRPSGKRRAWPILRSCALQSVAPMPRVTAISTS